MFPVAESKVRGAAGFTSEERREKEGEGREDLIIRAEIEMRWVRENTDQAT